MAARTVTDPKELAIFEVRDLWAYYNEKPAIRKVSLKIPEKKITAIMGPSGCGKTTFIRCLNRLHELTPGASIKGEILLRDKNILEMDPVLVRRKIGMVFQRPNPFPTMTIYDNVIAGYKLLGVRLKREEADRIVEEALRKAALWDEVKDSLHKRGTYLSGGQQQRLCIARALAVKPEVLLMDEPTSALDPKSTAKIEELIVELKRSVTIVIVTHNIAQAGRVADYTAFFYLGELVEFGPTSEIFTVPKDPRTEEFLKGKFG
ncbi:phosphate ABC transporter ATP-binding protein PstB [Thermosulfurimonas dismutans]|uniref:Phosphate transport ATP-binding protein PstB n=1 Tax=Thermosulfurimonas dismutans TaxID=999894 RepID=A0A179D6M6_9BACT|nr:phosphate ABC transporter ATP-binding protein PstB [Thermosulfurimonas dismutans]OAQ21696.1 Phosphate transport ATP-binding protein PstB [Thermosulfurimonas dismutans]